MIFVFIPTIFGSIFLAVLSASILWKYEKRYFLGFIPVLAMIPVGLLLMLAFFNYHPLFLSDEHYAEILYLFCFIYFFIQFLIVLKYVKKKRMNNI